MEFQTTVLGKTYQFTALGRQNFLVSAQDEEYILYQNNRRWNCADDIHEQLLMHLAEAIEEYMRVPH
jgi:hypothetical protein